MGWQEINDLLISIMFCFWLNEGSRSHSLISKNKVIESLILYPLPWYIYWSGKPLNLEPLAVTIYNLFYNPPNKFSLLFWVQRVYSVLGIIYYSVCTKMLPELVYINLKQVYDVKQILSREMADYIVFKTI